MTGAYEQGEKAFGDAIGDDAFGIAVEWPNSGAYHGVPVGGVTPNKDGVETYVRVAGKWVAVETFIRVDGEWVAPIDISLSKSDGSWSSWE